jgi:DNA-binding NarL/FixJ family response regulator
MAKKIVLVGHCGPDSSYLRMAVKNAFRDADVYMADDDRELEQAIERGADLLLLNRQLEYGFKDHLGVDVIRRLRAEHAELRMMLVSNYADAQAEAVEAGALQGFGKREIGSARVSELLRTALNGQAASTPATPATTRQI